MKKPRENRAARLAGLGVDQWRIDRLLDLLAAGRDMRIGTVLGEALEMFIEKELDENKGIAGRFNELQRQRRAANNPGIHAVPKPTTETD